MNAYLYRSLCAACLTWASLVVHAELPDSVAKALQAEGVPLESVSAYVQQVDSQNDIKPLLSHRADQAMNPASTMKVLTSYAALELLGPAYRWQTQFYTKAPPKSGVISGDLWVKGSGDPSLNTEALREVAQVIRQKDITKICCGLVLDNNAFEPNSFDAGAFDGKPYRAYNAPADALMVNQQALRLQFIPEGNKVRVISYPTWSELRINAKLVPQPGSCGDWKEAIQISHENNVLDLRGAYATDCGEKYLDVYWQTEPNYFASLFYALWKDTGGRWLSAYKNRTQRKAEKSAVLPQLQVRFDKVPDDATLIVEHTSPMLADILRDMNKTSNNPMARAVYLALGRSANSSLAASPAASVMAVQNWLRGKGLQYPELVLENGAGLSRIERISARHLGQLLQLAYASPVMPELISSLPLLGVDGTLERRKESPLLGRAHLKTGSLEGVHSIAGYVLDQKGRRWAVVFMVNHSKAAASRAAEDALLDWVYHQG